MARPATFPDRMPSSKSATCFYNLLADAAKWRAFVLNRGQRNAITEGKERRLCLSLLDHIDSAALGDAAGTQFRIIGIGHGARSDDGAGDQIARAGGMGDKGSVANSDTVSKIGLMYCQGQLR